MKSLDCEVWGFHSFGIEDSSLLDCYSQRDIPPPPSNVDDPHFLWLLIPPTQHNIQKAKSWQNWTYYLIYNFIYLKLIWYESHICSKSRWCQTCWQCKLTIFVGSDVKWVKQSFHLFKLEEPLSCGGTQRRKLWSRSFLCSWVVVSILHLCKH
jgi:hypothetical protein